MVAADVATAERYASPPDPPEFLEAARDIMENYNLDMPNNVYGYALVHSIDNNYR